MAFVTLLLDRGTDPNLRSNTDEQTALHYAAYRVNNTAMSLQLARLLISRGADVAAKDKVRIQGALTNNT